MSFFQEHGRGLRNVGLFLLAVAVIVFFGTRENPIGVLFATPVLVTGFTYLLSKNPKWIKRGAVIGVLAGIGFYVACL